MQNFEIKNPMRVLLMRSSALALMATMAVGFAPEVLAQGAGNASSGGPSTEQVIVTANKRAEEIQDVPISITALSGADLDASPKRGLLDELTSVPGVALRTNFQGGSPQISIRGVGASSSLFNGASPIGFYLDSTPFSMIRSALLPDVNVYDLDHIEVLRGPQGTLYGASSLNGVVRVLTADPVMNEFSAKGRASLSEVENGSLGYRSDAAVNIPLIDNLLSVRVVGGHSQGGGWVDLADNSQRDINKSNHANIRAKVLITPTDELSIVLSAWHNYDNSKHPDISFPNDTALALNTQSEPYLSRFDQYAGKIKYDFDGFTVTNDVSLLSYLNRSNLFLGPQLGGPLGFDTRMASSIVSNELLVSSSDESSWQWTLGGIFRQASEIKYQVLAQQKDDLRSGSWAAYGQLTKLLFDDKLELTAGLRYFYDSQSYSGGWTPPPTVAHYSFSKVSPKASVTYHLDENQMVYATYSQGFRSGYAQYQAAVRLNLPGAGADSLNNYEIGSKGGFFNGLLNYDASFYYIDWKRIQQTVGFQVLVNGVLAGIPAGVNAGDAGGFGTDISLTLHPMEGLSVNGYYNYSGLQYSSDVLNPSNNAVIFRKGSPLTDTPQQTYGGSVSYNKQFGDGWVAGLTGSVNYTSALRSVSVNAAGANVYSNGPNMVLAQSSFSLTAPNNWVFTWFVQNMLNNRRQPTSPANVGIPEWGSSISPRTIGFQVEYKY